MLLTPDIPALMRMDDAGKVLTSLVTVSGGDAGTYYALQENQLIPQGEIQLYADQPPPRLTIEDMPLDLRQTAVRLTGAGARLLVPVYAYDDMTLRGMAVIDKAGPEPFHAAQQAATAVIARHFGCFFGKEESHLARLKLRQLAEVPEARQHIYEQLAKPMLEYFNQEPELASHIQRVPLVADMLMEAMQRDAQQGGALGFTITPQHRPVLASLVRLHDIGKMQMAESELAYAHPATEKRSMHPFLTFLILNLPGLERDALITADHHQGNMQPFASIPAEQRHAFSRVIALADKLEAMISRRSYKNRGRQYSVAEAFAELSTRPPENVDPALLRAAVTQRVDEAIAAHPAFQDVLPSRDLSRIDETFPGSLEKMRRAGFTQQDGMEELRGKIVARCRKPELDLHGQRATYLTAAADSRMRKPWTGFVAAGASDISISSWGNR